MKQLNKALLICLTLSALPALAIPSMGRIKEAGKTTVLGCLTAGSLLLAYKAYYPYIQEINGKFFRPIRKTGSMPQKSATVEAALGAAVMSGLLYSTYYFGKKFGQRFGWFTKKPAEEQASK